MIRLMTAKDIPAGMRLKEAAGWNQTTRDWANLLAIEPQGCWVYEADGVIAGSTTAVLYGQDLAWIGMVLVLPEYRGQGIARRLMQHALRYLDECGVRCVKLDATDMGKPLYEQLGFVDEAVIERWAGISDAHDAEEPETGTERLADTVAIAERDRAAFGADRSRLLQRLLEVFPHDAVRLPGGYVMGRPGSNAHFIGPCVADDPRAARRLIAHVLERHAGTPLFWDLLPDNEEAAALARSLGFEPRRKLWRMLRTSAECPSGNVQQVFAAAGFEYG